MKPCVVILGGSGVFGSRLARRLIAQGEVRAVIAGRNRARAEAFCRQHGGEADCLDRNGERPGPLGRLRPFVIVDAAGPFQDDGPDPETERA